MTTQKKKAITLDSESHLDLHAMLTYFRGIREPTIKKTQQELDEIRAHSESLGDNDGGACWFKNTTGGDYCEDYSPAECTKRGGQPVQGNCPHFFAALAAARRLSNELASKVKKRPAKRTKVKRP